MKNANLKLTLAFALLACPLWGQSDQQFVRKVVRVEHVNAEELAGLLHKWVGTSPSRVLRAVALQGTQQQIEQAERVIRELDVPDKRNAPRTIETVEVTVHLIGVVGAEGDSFSGSPLESVVSQLRTQFGYDAFRRLDSFSVRGLMGKGLSVEGALPGDGLPRDGFGYKFQVNTRKWSDDSAADVELSGLEVSLHRRSDTQHANQVGIQTSLGVPQGKLVVVGKVGTDDSLMEGLFVVLSARLVE